MKQFLTIIAAFLIIGSMVSSPARADELISRLALPIEQAAQTQLGVKATRVQATLRPSVHAMTVLREASARPGATIVVSTSKRLLGDVLVPVTVVADKQVIATVTISTAIQAWGPVVVAVADIRRSQAIDSSQVRVVEREITRLSDQRLIRSEDAVGRQAALLIPAGSVVTRSAVKPMPTIAKGERVMLVGKASGIRIESPGVALEDGHLNGSIQVKSQYNKVLVGRVRGDQTVEIRLY